MRTHWRMKQTRIHTDINRANKRVSFNFCFDKNFQKVCSRKVQGSLYLIFHTTSSPEILLLSLSIYQNIPLFIMSLSTVALTRCPAETVFLCDETDVIRYTTKGTRSAQDILCATLLNIIKPASHLQCAFLCFAQFPPYILILYLRKLTDRTL
jgi:hypothetical protein